MESVVATVSGYSGIERFNLIKLISRTGANFVGNMNRYTTHLVCWKFEGKKYEFAKRFNIKIVNHCWIEECIKKGTRVSEEPYTFQSGEEMGHLLLDIQLGLNQTNAQSKEKMKLKEPVIDIDSEDTDDAARLETTFLDELEEPSMIQPTCSRRLKKRDQTSLECHRKGRKLVKKHRIVDDHLSIFDVEQEHEEVNVVPMIQPTRSRRLKKRDQPSPECHRKGRKLVKKHSLLDDNISILDAEQEHEEVNVVPMNNRREIQPNSPDVERPLNTSNRHASDVQYDNDALRDVVEIADVNDESENECGDGPLSSSKYLEKHHEADVEDFTDTNKSDRPSTSTELSCVICLTDFCSTRGVLSCGHRFCFKCIQNWADRRASEGKPSTCPLCKVSFICITKVDDVVPSDQKIFSQTIPYDNSKMDLYILPEEVSALPANVLYIQPSAQVCYRCLRREPEDCLIQCSCCGTRCVHNYCLDPPLLPWTCIQCKDLRRLYYNSR